MIRRMARYARRVIPLLGHPALIQVAALFLVSASLYAGSSSGSSVSLDFQPDRVSAELVIPLSELELAFGQPLTMHPEDIIPRFGSALEQYVSEHISATAPDGAAWRVEVKDLQLKSALNPAMPATALVVHLEMYPPAGAPLRKFALHYDVVGRENPRHETILTVRSDWDAGLLSGQPTEIIGSIRATSAAGLIEIDRSNGSWWLGFASFIGLGLQSTAGRGGDLLFLAVLLLPVPLLSVRGHWRRPAHTRQIFGRLAKMMSAFTLGCSMTFLASALSGTQLPPQLRAVLALLALIAAAIHSIRPIFARHTGVASAMFGLVYGLIFAGGMPSFDLSPPYALSAAIAYAIGIGLMLLLATLLFTPSLILLSRTRFYRPVQITILALALVVSASLPLSS